MKVRKVTRIIDTARKDNSMTDKVQKIRNEVERLKNELIQEREKGYGSDVDDACILELQNVLTYIDTLQEEPVSVWHDSNKEQPNYSSTVAIWNPKYKNGEIISRCTEVYPDRIWAYIDDILKLSNLERIGRNWKEEPVSEDLEELINKLSAQFPEVSFAKLSRIAVRVAKWQEKKDQSTIELAEDHAMLAGMEKMKEQMMAKAVDVTAHIDAGGYPYIPQMELYDYDKDVPLAKEGDKYKVILIKEE